MQLHEKNEDIFDVGMNIWEDVKTPAVRYYYRFFIIEMIKKYPEIKNELDYLTADYYTKTISPAIKRIFEKELAKF